MTIPVWCTSIRPISGTANKIYETQVPVSCGGVAVDPGDWVFGDADGIIVGSRAEIEPLLPTAEAIVRNEEAAVAAMHRCAHQRMLPAFIDCSLSTQHDVRMKPLVFSSGLALCRGVSLLDQLTFREHYTAIASVRPVTKWFLKANCTVFNAYSARQGNSSQLAFRDDSSRIEAG